MADIKADIEKAVGKYKKDLISKGTPAHAAEKRAEQYRKQLLQTAKRGG